MYTLKIRWFRLEKGELADETTLFIPADEIKVHGEITSLEQMKAWSEGSYLDYTIHQNESDEIISSRIIEVLKDGNMKWYLVTRAWLLGPDGKTIENLLP